MNPDHPQVEEQMIVQPQPVPVSVLVGSAQMADGSPIVVAQVSTFTGTAVYFLPRDVALEVASNLRKAAQTGPQLVAPPAGFQVPRT